VTRGKYLKKGGGGAGMLRSSASAGQTSDGEWCAQSIRGRSGARQLRKAKNRARPAGRRLARMRKTQRMRPPLTPRVAAEQCENGTHLNFKNAHGCLPAWLRID